MKREIELLAPGGDIDSIKAAILAGADAIYCGLDKFNARNRAANITFNDLNGILRLAHKHDCEVFLTLNIIIVETEMPALIGLLNKLVNTKIDGVIVQDLGLLYLLLTYFPTLKVHASTQLTTHNEGQIKFLHELNATRVNLSRELNISEISSLATVGHEHNMLTEVFVHGSNCISFSGLCYMSSLHGGNSGNRGRCSQPCRDQYVTTAEGNDFPLNIKDNSAYSDLRALSDAGVDSIKIEGRIKKYHYVYTVVDTWRKHLQNFYQQDIVDSDSHDLRKVFNRDFSNAFLQGDIGKNVFIDDPRDNSALHRSTIHGDASAASLDDAKRELYDIKTEIITNVKQQIDRLSTAKGALKITVSGRADTLLKLTVETPETSFEVESALSLSALKPEDDANYGKKKSSQSIGHEFLLKRLQPLNETEYFIEQLDLSELEEGLFIPFKSLTEIKNQILFLLNDSKAYLKPVELPVTKKWRDAKITPSLSVLISSARDLHLCNDSSAEIYYQLPNSFTANDPELASLFLENRRLIPWFPAVMIGDNYHAAVSLLEQLKPQRIVTNNTGIAYEAWQRGISWVAGPYLNLVNTFSLLCLKEKFNCAGAFLSNEINREQLWRINKPDDFDLYYSIYHPISLMTSRVCMFHQVTGCKKNVVDNACIRRCEKSSLITNLKEVSLFIKKSRGNYHGVYNQLNCLNTEVVTDLADRFTGFVVDLRDIKTDTRVECGKSDVVRLFENHIHRQAGAEQALKSSIHPTTNSQYSKGI